MIVHTDIEQGSPEWLMMRAGKITASEADSLISPLGKVRDGDGVETYLNQKLVERWTGAPLPQLQGIFAMDQGEILEERAKPAFTLHTGIETRNVAFIETDDGRAGCSPDAIVGESEGVEIKCPTMPKHVGYLRAGRLPRDYIAQVQFSLFVTGFKTWHFFSYSRQFPSLHLVVERDERFQAALNEAIDMFIERLDKAFDYLVDLNGGPRA